MQKMEPIAFILAFFPRKTETFIHNELITLKKYNIPFTVFTIVQPKSEWVTQPLFQSIIDQNVKSISWTGYLRGFFRAIRKPVPFFQHMRWITTLEHKNKWFCLRMLSALLIAYDLYSEILARKFRYLHAHFASYPTEIAMCLARLTNIPYGSSWHAFDIWRDQNILREKIHYAKQIIANNQYNYNYLTQLAGTNTQSKLHLLYNRLDLTAFPPPLPINLSQPLIAVGRIISKKGFIYLIEAIAQLKQNHQMVTLKIVGPTEPLWQQLILRNGSEFKRLQSTIKKYKLEDQIEFISYLSHEKTLELINQSAMLIMPCVEDQFHNIDGIPNVILEAMALQKPIIASRIAGIPEVIIDGKTGVLVEPKDVDGIARAISGLLHNQILAEKIGYQAYLHLREKLSVLQYEESLCKLFG